MPQLITVFWRDIPAQVIAKERRQKEKVQLTERFAEAIDAAAMRAGKGSTDAYLEEWKRVPVKCGDDLKAEAEAAAAKLEEEYDRERLIALVKNEGHNPDS
jgi:hypothetical protein